MEVAVRGGNPSASAGDVLFDGSVSIFGGGGGRTSHLIPPGRQGRIGEAVTSFALKLFLGPLLTHVFSTSSRSSDRRQRCNRGQNSRNSALGRNRREMGPYDTLVELTPRNSSGPCRLRTSVHVQHGRGEDGSHVLWLTKRSSEDSHALPAGGVTTSQLVPYKELLSPGLCVTLLAVGLFEKAIQDFGVSVVNSQCGQTPASELENSWRERPGLGAERAPMSGRE